MTPDLVGGAIVKATEEAIESGNSLLMLLLGPSVKAVGDEWGERVRAKFARNRDATLQKFTELVAHAGTEVREPPFRLTAAVLEGAAREDEPTMQARWASLLANAALRQDLDSPPPLYATLLSGLTPLAAHVLDTVDAITLETRYHDPPGPGNITRWGVRLPEVAAALGFNASSDIEPVQLAMGMLETLGLLAREPGGREAEGTWILTDSEELKLSLIGADFCRQVRPPKPQ